MQVLYLGHAPITRVEKTGRDGQKSEQGMVSQPDPPRHLGGCYTLACPAHKETGFSCAYIGHSGAQGMQEIQSRHSGTLPGGQTNARSPQSDLMRFTGVSPGSIGTVKEVPGPGRGHVASNTGRLVGEDLCRTPCTGPVQKNCRTRVPSYCCLCLCGCKYEIGTVIPLGILAGNVS